MRRSAGSPEHGSGRRLGAACAVGLTTVLVAAGCVRSTEYRDPPAEPGLSPSASPGAGPAGTGATYNAVGLDLCAGADLAALGDLALRIDRRQPRQPPSAPGSACQFEMTTPSGHRATLLVEASTPASADDAGRLYRAARDVSVLRPDGPVGGIGEEAEGFAQQSEPGFKQSEYLIHARSGNLVLKVWLAVGGPAFTPEDVLAEKTAAIAGATLPTIPGS